jgi:ABC-2 type transport system ATP-binding protein
VVEIEVFGIPGDRVDAVRGLDGVSSVLLEENGHAQLLVVHTDAAAQVTPTVLGSLSGLALGRVMTREPTLEDAYVELVRDA